jgi:hypothetical protein
VPRSEKPTSEGLCIAKHVKDRRAARGWSQDELAQHAKLDDKGPRRRTRRYTSGCTRPLKPSWRSLSSSLGLGARNTQVLGLSRPRSAMVTIRLSTSPQGAQAQPVDSGSQCGPGPHLAEFDSPRSHERLHAHQDRSAHSTLWPPTFHCPTDDGLGQCRGVHRCRVLVLRLDPSAMYQVRSHRVDPLQPLHRVWRIEVLPQEQGAAATELVGQAGCGRRRTPTTSVDRSRSLLLPDFVGP